MRERLLADGHAEVDGGGDVAVVNTCCVTNEAVSKSRQAAARAARTPSARLRDRLWCEPRRRLRRPAGQRRRRRAAERGDAGGRRRRRRRDRLRPGRSPARPRPRVRQDPGRLPLLLRLLRDPARPRCDAEPLGRRRARRDPPPGRPGPSRDRPHRRQPRLLPRPRGRVHARPARPRGRGGRQGSERLRLSSIEINHVDDELVAALRETPTVSPHLHVPLQSGDDGILRAMGRRYTVAQYLRQARAPARTSTSPPT